ncbi:MAG: creatininase family protein [Casimicrobium sp.]
MNRAVARLVCAFASGMALLAGELSAAPPPIAANIYLESMTSPEVRDAIKAGATTIIIPIGGTEQNGPHMTLGKHNVRVHALAGRIADVLKNTLVAPTLAYVPEGSILPPAAHMKFAGTISISDEAFKSLLDSAARSFAQHGFTDIVFIGDHGGYQSQLAAVADGLNKRWKGTPARAHFIASYYRASAAPYSIVLREKGLTEAQIGVHAGSADTSLMLAVDPDQVRINRINDAAEPKQGGLAHGVNGDPRAASAALGQLGVDAMIAASVNEIRKALAAKRP